MGLGTANTKLTYPPGKDTDVLKFAHAYAGYEAIRLRHNEKAGDLTKAAEAFRARCREAMTRCLDDVLELRKTVTTPGWKQTDKEPVDPKQAKGKADGKVDHASANIKELTGIDVDRVDRVAP